tara:strand:+ start:420 stop:821 length:402 start_codon:yes stop_codon:yes gene_type:complete
MSKEVVIDLGDTAYITSKRIGRTINNITRKIYTNLFGLGKLNIARLIRYKTRTIKDKNGNYIYKPNYEIYKAKLDKRKPTPPPPPPSQENIVNIIKNLGKNCYYKIKKTKKKGGFRRRKKVNKVMSKKRAKKI